MLTSTRPIIFGMALIAAACSGGGGNDDDDTTSPTNDDDSTVGDDTANDDDDDTVEPFDPAQLAGRTWAFPDQTLGDFVSPQYLAEFLGPMYDDTSGPKLLIGFDGTGWTPTPMLDLEHQDWTGSRHSIAVTEQGGEHYTLEIARESGFRLVQTNIKLDLFDVRTTVTFAAAHIEHPLAVTRFRFFPPVGSAFDGVCNTHPDSCTPDGAVEFLAENVRVLELSDPPTVFLSPLEGCQEDPAVDWSALVGTEWEMEETSSYVVLPHWPTYHPGLMPSPMQQTYHLRLADAGPSSMQWELHWGQWATAFEASPQAGSCLAFNIKSFPILDEAGIHPLRFLTVGRFDPATGNLASIVMDVEFSGEELSAFMGTDVCMMGENACESEGRFRTLAIGMTAHRMEP